MANKVDLFAKNINSSNNLYKIATALCQQLDRAGKHTDWTEWLKSFRHWEDLSLFKFLAVIEENPKRWAFKKESERGTEKYLFLFLYFVRTQELWLSDVVVSDGIKYYNSSRMHS